MSGQDESVAFGELLQRFRTRCRLTQQQLATSIGMHRNAISRWEQGVFLPKQKSLVLELAKRLHLDEQEIRHLLEASFTATAPHWSVPWTRNPFFTGREELLETLHTYLGVNQVEAHTQSAALHGLGGVGKTQLALEYAYRHALEYNAIFWIAAETIEQIISSLLRIAEVLQVPGRDDNDQQRVVGGVLNWLSTHPHWLLIWDNVEDLDLLASFLPKARGGVMLLTTRHIALGPLARSFDLLPMDQEEGMLFVLRRAKLLEQEAGYEQLSQLAQRLPAEYAAAEVLITRLGKLPLALDQVGAYCEEAGCSLSDYLRHYEHHQAHLLGRRGRFGKDHPHSVNATFRLAIEQVEQEHPAAANILRICALVQAEAIPEELFVGEKVELGPNLADLVADSFHFDQAMTVLRNLSLLQRHPETHTLSIHRLVQAVVSDWMGEQERIVWLKWLIAALNTLFPENPADAHVWEQSERLLSHVLAVAAALPASAGDQKLVEVLRKTADYLHERAQYKRAEQVYQQAISIGEQLLGPEHPALAPALSGLAFLFGRQNRYEQAEALGRQALSLSEQTLGSVHPQVAASLTTLAILYVNQDKHAQAEPLLVRSISIWEHTLGQNHPQVAVPLSRLAHLYWRQGNYKQAEPLLARALLIQQQASGPEALQMAQPLYDLALLYWKQGQYREAEPLFQRARSIWQQVYGREHPLVAYALRGLALLSSEQGNYVQAEHLFQQELHIWQQVWGSEHYQVAVSLMNLGELYAKQGKDTQAEPLLQQAWQTAEQVWGSEHPQVAYPMRTLAQIYATNGKYAQAEALFQRAIQIWEKALGQEHPNVAAALNGLASLFLRQEKNEQAEEVSQRALIIQEQHLGPDHPETAQTLYNLAVFHQKQGHLTEARSLAKRALSIYVPSLGDAHPKTVATQTLYAQLQAKQVNAQRQLTSHQNGEISSDSQRETFLEEKAPLPLHEAGASSPSDEQDALQEFFAACCEFHPRAWCTIHDLWHTYEHWTVTEQKCVPLPRRAFAARLKARECRVGRTSKVRIWQGIRLVSKRV